MPYQDLVIGPLEGLHEDENPHHIGSADLIVAENIARLGQYVGTRPGFVRPANGEDYDESMKDLTGVIRNDQTIQGAAEYRRDFDEDRALIVVAKERLLAPAVADVWFGSDGSSEKLLNSDPAQLTSGPANLWTFANHRNRLWATGGAPTDDIWSWDGDTAGVGIKQEIITDKAAGNTKVLRPKFIIAWRNYLLINGLRPDRADITESNNAAVSRFCNLGGDVQDDAQWVVGNTLGFDASGTAATTYGPSYTTGFGTYRDNQGDFLLELRQNQILSYRLGADVGVSGVDFVLTDAISFGCISQRVFVDLGVDAGDSIYMSPDGTVHSLRASQAAGLRDPSLFLSWKIRETIGSINTAILDRAAAAYDPLKGRVLFAIPTGSNSFLDTILCLEIQELDAITSDTVRWYRWRPTARTSTAAGFNVVDVGYFRDSNDVGHFYLFGDRGDIAWVDEDQFVDITDDDSDDSGYSWEVQTRYEDYGSTMEQKTQGDVMLTLSADGNYSCNYQTVFDYGARSTQSQSVELTGTTGSVFGTAVFGTDKFGSGNIVQDKKIYGLGRGRTVSHRIFGSGANKPVRIGKVQSQVRVNREAGEAS